MKKIAVIGAGPAGMTAAYELAKEKDIQVQLFEASNAVGGMSKTINLLGQRVDLGPHRFFSSDPRVNKLWLEVVGRNYEMVNRLTRIYYNKKFYYYPLKAFNALFNMGIFSATRCVLSYAFRRFFPLKDESNFENWVTNRFGSRLYNIFFKSYTEKLWGISCRILDSDFAAQRIKKLSLYEAIKNAVFAGKGNQHKTLVDQFAYPIGGTGVVYEEMAKQFSQSGGQLSLGTPIKRVLLSGNRVTGIEDVNGKVYDGLDQVISSMPLTELVNRMEGLPDNVRQACQKLKFRNTVLIFLKIESNDLFPDQWLYLHAADLQVGRVTNFRNWSPSLYGNDSGTILALEYWCYSEDPLWAQNDQSLIGLASDEIRATGLIGNQKIVGGAVYRVSKSYPVYDNTYKENLGLVEAYLNTIENLHPIGRYGAFKYNNQDHSILMGLLAAEKIAKSKTHNLWDINTDYEYQESSKITETGLKLD
jgi:protoporphyrinogen oxidase